MKRVLLLSFLLVNFILSFGQDKRGEVLFTIDKDSFYTAEFTRVYNKNLELVKDDSQKDLNNYLDLFIGYKLKVEKAKKLGLQNNSKYQNELNSYRNQLAKNYLNDSKVTNALINEAYDRMKNEVRAAHILIMVDENASANDTLKAYNKIKDILKKIKAGESFEELAAKFSEDPSAKMNNGDLGYFTAFRMVYPFESAAYNTKVGEVSNIIRSRFGYHLVNVLDKRENRGDVTVKHIMLLNSKDNNPEENKKNEEAINEIYQKIVQGENFDELAKQFSDDKSTSSKGGLLQRFSAGQLTSTEFENVAFSLKNKEDVSKPFQSKFGWHIIKLVEKHPIPAFETLKNDIENKVRRDDRSRLITSSLVEKLSKKYPISQNDKLLKKVTGLIDNSFFSMSWVKPTQFKEINEDIITINKEKRIKASAFLDFIESQQKAGYKNTSIDVLVTELFNKWKEEQLINYYNQNLEREVPEFNYVMEEYRDGLLLFDLMEKEIWDKAKQDSVGLENYFKSHQNKYLWKDRFEVEIYSSTDQNIIAKTKKYIQKNKDQEYIKEKLNKNGKINVMVKSGLFEENYDILSEINIETTGATNVIKKGNYYFVVNVLQIMPSGPKKLEECKGLVVSDYQQFLEDNWVDELKKEFSVKVDNQVFEKVKKQLKK